MKNHPDGEKMVQILGRAWGNQCHGRTMGISPYTLKRHWEASQILCERRGYRMETMYGILGVVDGFSRISI